MVLTDLGPNLLRKSLTTGRLPCAEHSSCHRGCSRSAEIFSCLHDRHALPVAASDQTAFSGIQLEL